MRQNEKVERYWAVWIFNPKLGTSGRWEPYEEGFTTKRASERAKSEAEKQYGEAERFALVKTIHERVSPILTKAAARTK